MIERHTLLADLKALVATLTDDLRDRASTTGDPVAETVAREYATARAAGRTAQSESAWREDLLVQGAVAWVLSSVFVRFMEDNGLVDVAWLSGPAARRQEARARRRGYFAEHPLETDREVLHAAFRAAAAAPAAAPLFDERHNPLWRLPVSGDGARAILEVWDRLDDASEAVRLRHDFTDPARDTRFLGDLYQDISDAAREKYALLQTPEFVESFILDRTLEPALAEFGLPPLKLIDPTCGSGHFLIGAFERLLARWQDAEPGTPLPELADRALRAVHGVDVNPYAVAIARFRLTVAALQACGIRRIADAPAWDVRVACGDSLLHGPEEGQLDAAAFGAALVREGLDHHYLTEDAEDLGRWLRPGYHVVVGNPPYITVKDAALNAAYRARYSACHREYALTVPFMQRFFDLARGAGGWVGQITGNNFMKREFGSKLVEDFIPTVDVQTVIDTAGAYIPGHGTPTVILIGQARNPVLGTVRAVMGIRGEPGPPVDPATGHVWRAIVEQVDRPGSESAYVSVEDLDRALLHKHPWSLAGGGASSLRTRIERVQERLDDLAGAIGFSAISGEDDSLLFPAERDLVRLGVAQKVELVNGTAVREWTLTTNRAVWPYDEGNALAPLEASTLRVLWPRQSYLLARKLFGEPITTRGLAWYEWREFYREKHQVPLTITWGEVATHNHFVLDRGGKVFNRTAPVIKLPKGTSEEAHFALLGVLNSSTTCFWLKQVCQTKGGGGVNEGFRGDGWEFFFQFNVTKAKQMPLPALRRPDLATELDRLARQRAARLAEVSALLDGGAVALAEAEHADTEDMARMIALQEELDWETLAAYGLVSDKLSRPGLEAPPIRLGERAFEIVLARSGAETTWFSRHRSSPVTELPADWPAGYREIVERRIAMIESDRDVGLIERSENKRRWSQPTWAERERQVMRSYLLDRVEELSDWAAGQMITCAQVADRLAADERVRLATQRYAGAVDVDLERTLTALIAEESVPYLAAHRHTEAGLRKRADWEATWDLQRREDAGEAVGEIPLPPKYGDKDWRASRYKQLRGKLDVPKERFTSVPDGQRTGDPSPVLGWAGWDHAQLAFALAGRVTLLRDADGAGEDRVMPLLAGIAELLPWVRQWNPEPDPDTGQPPHVELEAFVDGELRRLGRAYDELPGWRPPEKAKRGRKAKSVA
ncbi:BREX-2 system adenine-specific DNA-methyltransferase PglX [Baekduia sp. Peel2402]|uniref:BREX-2 system adenine-specific DNA-methyltransferase PglX n=1 Tax=Baekduia sp. Peel2402 TaxID=3458296 RepID=UPI00403E725D